MLHELATTISTRLHAVGKLNKHPDCKPGCTCPTCSHIIAVTSQLIRSILEDHHKQLKSYTQQYLSAYPRTETHKTP